MKDQSYQKHKTIIGKSNEQFYEIQNKQKGINITIFDPNTQQQRQCQLTIQELLNMQYLPEKLKNPQNWMYEFAEIKQSGRYEFIQINPDRNIIITFKPVNQQEGFSVTLISKIVPKKDVPIELHSLSIIVGQIVEERMAIVNRDIFDKIEQRIDQKISNRQIETQQKKQKISLKLWAVVLFVILTVLLVYRFYGMQNKQKGPDYIKQIKKLKRGLSKLNKYKHHKEISDQLSWKYLGGDLGMIQNRIREIQERIDSQINRNADTFANLENKITHTINQTANANLMLGFIQGNQKQLDSFTKRLNGVIGQLIQEITDIKSFTRIPESKLNTQKSQSRPNRRHV